jgi:hypothetical protein
MNPECHCVSWEKLCEKVLLHLHDWSEQFLEHFYYSWFIFQSDNYPLKESGQFGSHIFLRHVLVPLVNRM